MSYDQYTGTRSGINAQGNHYRSHPDGSYSYENLDGSTYRKDATGSATYTSPSGYVKKYGTSVPSVQTQPRLPQDFLGSRASDSDAMGSSTYTSPSSYVKKYGASVAPRRNATKIVTRTHALAIV
ncbi:hypothetical protein B0H16DRAFT_1781559 [Mycena metata]|uniref:Uncharacterized protein n=1 Tax=Mycena metata TaxID=1033252 RepID=A0AAD7MNZ8_9AGAR|nr:hypothetical protein B0H16DRAFT_1781559 [Mycena metata]